MSKILLSIYKNSYLSHILGFKGGTCAMLFYGLDRFSVDLDLDFDFLIDFENIEIDKFDFEMKKILNEFGEITDFANKKNTVLYEIRYKKDYRRLKLEISKRGKAGNYVLKNFLGESIWIMKEEDLFSNKLVALLNRKGVANRDIYDIWFFFSKGVEINSEIIKKFTGKSLNEYLLEIKKFLEKYDFKKVLYGLGDFLDDKKKDFVKTKMKDELLGFIDLYLS